MKSARQICVAGTLALAFAGCRHTQTTQLAPAQPPSIKTQKPAAPPSGNPLSTQSPPPLPSLPPATEDASKHAPPPPPKVHHRRKPKPAETASADTTAAAPETTPPAVAVTAPPTAAPPAGPQTAEATPAPAANATPIGTLSTGDVSTSTRARKDTLDLISGTESGLNNIKRTLESVTDKQTAEQIRTFLQKAKAALELDDLDGAHTLATKAKVLLDELTKQ